MTSNPTLDRHAPRPASPTPLGRAARNLYVAETLRDLPRVRRELRRALKAGITLDALLNEMARRYGHAFDGGSFH